MCDVPVLRDIQSPSPTEHRVPLNPHSVPLHRGAWGNDGPTYAEDVKDLIATATSGRDVQPALIGQHYITERDSVPVQYNRIVGTGTLRCCGYPL